MGYGGMNEALGVVLGWHPGPAALPSVHSSSDRQPRVLFPKCPLRLSVCLSLFLSLCLSICFFLHLSDTLCLACWLSLFLSISLCVSLSLLPSPPPRSPLPSQNLFFRGGNHSSWGCQVGQAHVPMAQKALFDTGGAGGQFQGLCSEWLLLSAFPTCQIHLTCRDFRPPLQMRPAGGGFHLTGAEKLTPSYIEGPLTWQTLFLDPWSPSIPLTSLEVPLPVI